MNCVQIISHRLLMILNGFLKNLENEKNKVAYSPDLLHRSIYNIGNGGIHHVHGDS